MRYKDLHKHLLESTLQSTVESHCAYFGHSIVQTTEGIYVDGMPTHHCSIQEAKSSINQSNTINAIKSDIYEDVSSQKVAKIIRSHHDVRVTDTLIESYVELAASKTFTADQVVHDIRRLNKFDSILEGRFDYKLDDGSVVLVTEETQKKLNTLSDQNVNYMRSNKFNFLEMVSQLKD